MKDDRKMTSIARRMNRSWLFRMALVLLIVDVALAGIAVFGFCYLAETANGGWEQTRLSRELAWDVSRPIWERPLTISYTYADDSGTTYTASGQGYFQLTQALFGAMLVLEGVLLLAQGLGGRRRARRLLLPLQRMAATTQELSRASLDPEKLHDLEDAIATVSPLSPDARLTTGDRELQGLEGAINDLLRRMQESYREQSRFVSDASHELRTPIAVIQGYADMLSRWGKGDEKVLDEGISAIQTESAHMKTLVEQLLFLARGDSGRTQLVMEEVDLCQMMREVMDESQMIHPNRRWRLRLAEERLPVQGDAALLKQAARVLVDNAVRYTADGDSITLIARQKENDPCFEVQDNGMGIKPEDLNHIFDRFYRSDPARARTTGGTGLGLSIAKWIVERHGGYFDVFSREDFGTRMSVILPQQAEEQ